MTARTEEQEPESALLDALLQDSDPGSYVVIPIGALVTQVMIAFRETNARGGKHRPARAMVRLALNLRELGWVHDLRAFPEDRGDAPPWSV